MIQELKHADLIRLLINSAGCGCCADNDELEKYQAEALRRLEPVCEHELDELIGGPACRKCGWTP